MFPKEKMVKKETTVRKFKFSVIILSVFGLRLAKVLYTHYFLMLIFLNMFEMEKSQYLLLIDLSEFVLNFNSCTEKGNIWNCLLSMEIKHMCLFPIPPKMELKL